MHLHLLNREQLSQLHATVLSRAFPPDELKPFSVMERHLDANCYDVWALEDGREDVSWALMWRAMDGSCVLLDYLVTLEQRRGEKLGSRLLEHLQKHYLPGIPILVESEAPTAEDPEQRHLQQRRLGFYHRLGFAYAGFDVLLFGVHYQVLALGEGTALKEAYRNLYRQGTTPAFFAQHLRILEGNQ